MKSWMAITGKAASAKEHGTRRGPTPPWPHAERTLVVAADPQVRHEQGPCGYEAGGGVYTVSRR